jgi:hypothetical protein
MPSSVVSNPVQNGSIKINQIRVFEIFYYISLAIPFIVGFYFYFLVLKERLFTGHWPYYNDPYPDAPLDLFSFFGFIVANVGIVPAIWSVFMALGMTIYAIFSKILSKKKLLLGTGVLLVSIVLLTLISLDIGGFGAWIRD